MWKQGELRENRKTRENRANQRKTYKNMAKQRELGENIVNHGKTGRIKEKHPEKHRKTWENRENLGKDRKT